MICDYFLSENSQDFGISEMATITREIEAECEYMLAEGLTDLTPALSSKVEDFIDKGHDLITECTMKKNAYSKKTTIWAFVSLGFIILAQLAPIIPGTGALVASGISIVGIMGTLIMTLIYNTKSNNELRKLRDLKDKALEIKAKTSNPKIKAKLDGLITRMDHGMKLYDYENPKRES